MYFQSLILNRNGDNRNHWVNMFYSDVILLLIANPTYVLSGYHLLTVLLRVVLREEMEENKQKMMLRRMTMDENVCDM